MAADGVGTSLPSAPGAATARALPAGSPVLFGRSEELAVLTGLVDAARSDAADSNGDRQGGAAVLVEGEAGIGKTALVTAVEQHARQAGFRVLRCTGLQGSNTVGFDGLHELLHPLLPYVAALPDRQRTALLTAFAVEEGPVPDRLLVSTAALGLLEEAASRRPVLVLAEDMQWTDRSSAEVLDFIGLRLSNAPIVVIATARTGHDVHVTLPCSFPPVRPRSARSRRRRDAPRHARRHPPSATLRHGSPPDPHRGRGGTHSPSTNSLPRSPPPGSRARRSPRACRPHVASSRRSSTSSPPCPSPAARSSSSRRSPTTLPCRT
ncbi:AAA family ATPase [Curtobacterium sp. MCPF17_052]|uniref:AAA family ATPase n=1 Tax=Curtobacterium sp. MCPF17_052 TaxID=2175655 RepID=UPI0024DFEFED|nr:ATP-binding protein [Curtobacterium sp. MCPF17_052]WIB12490.1 ATP-binding protein [Curtobacterium sp. MCPF17_052]